MNNREGVLIVLFSCFLCLVSLAQNQNLTVQSLVGTHIDTILQNHLVGEGVEISNGRFNNHAGSLNTAQLGIFNRNGFTSFPLETGLVMTTGNVQEASGPNTVNNYTSEVGVVAYTEPSLSSLATNDLFNCASLDFDFQTVSDTFVFRYVFASEEYCEYVNSDYNDIFAFFLTGEDPVTHVQTTKNVAIIPGTITATNPNGIPVAINNVNHGYHEAGESGPGINASYPQFFVHNNSYNGIQFDGYTTALSAGSNILACQMYHMKLSTGNVGDNFLDSGVFLEENSFESIPNPAFSMSSFYCLHDDILFNITAENVDSVHLVTPSGDTLRSQPFIVHDIMASDSGLYILWAKKAVDCNGSPWVSDSIFISIRIPCIPEVCDGPKMCAGEIAEFPFEWESVEGPWVNFVGDEVFTLNPPASLPHDTAIAYRFSLFDEYGCHFDTMVDVQYFALKHTYVDTAVCGDFLWNGVNYTEPGVYVVNATSEHGCDSIAELHLSIANVELSIVNLTEDFCENVFAELSVITTLEDYVWSTGESSPTIEVTTPGVYSVSGSLGACHATASIHIEGCELQIFLPNAITPSKSDGMNDLFGISDQQQRMIEDFEISIFSRWGDQVFYSTDKNFRWNGEVNGKVAVGSIFNYIIHCTDIIGKPYLFTGSVTVL